MKIFGIGLQKTGTSTLGVCLKKMGYQHISYNDNAISYFREANFQKLQSLIERYDSFEDEPWAHAFHYLYSWYPRAKFVLTVRKDPEAWFNSMCQHCQRIPHNPHRRFFFGHDTPFDHKDEYIKVYKNHIQNVLRTFKEDKDKLLVVCWEENDGWKQICDFLNTQVPDIPFPHANKKPPMNIKFLSKFRNMINRISIKSKN